LQRGFEELNERKNKWIYVEGLEQHLAHGLLLLTAYIRMPAARQALLKFRLADEWAGRVFPYLLTLCRDPTVNSIC
jgi:hypothetical protein